MKNEEMNVKEVRFIDEKSYQQIKKEMGKTSDYYSMTEWKKLGKKLT